MKLSTLFSFLILLLGSLVSVAQPDSEVFLFDLNSRDGQLSVTNLINISNNEGYDNQPSFWQDGKSILYARTVNGQTEIAQYSLKSGNTIILTNTQNGSEYSPTPMPDKRISSVRLDTTGLQLLYAYDMKGRSEVLVDDLVIGYHAWINPTTIVTFVLGKPATMQIINTKTGNTKVVANNIGRSLHKIPNSNNFSYVDKSSEVWTINQMDPKTFKSSVLTKVIDGAEDYAWTPDNKIIMGNSSQLFQYELDKNWIEFADLSNYGISKISRITVSPDGGRIVIVGEKE